MNSAATVKNTVTLLIVAFCATMWTLQIRANVRPHENAPPIDYGRLVPLGQDERRITFGIHLGEQRLGSSRTHIRRMPTGAIDVENRSVLNISRRLASIPGLGEIDVTFYASISPLRGLTSLRVFSRALNTSLVGTPRDDSLVLRGHVGSERVKTEFPHRPEAFLGQMLGPLETFSKLDENMVGQSWEVQIVNPILGSVQSVEVTVEETRRITLDGEDTIVFALNYRMGGREWGSWVTEAGEILVQGTPLGLTLIRDELPAATARSLLPE